MKISQECDSDQKHLLNGYGARRLSSEFPDKGWKLGSIESLLRLRKTGTIVRQPAAADHVWCVYENIEKVEDLVLSQESKLKRIDELVRFCVKLALGLIVIHRDLCYECFKRRHAPLLSECR